jgi:hypothetical protein
MIKKLVSEALLSLVMDKSARETLQARKTIKKAVTQIEKAKGVKVEAVAGPQDKAGLAGDSEETRKLILESIAAAEREFLDKPKLSPERQALIEQAMSVQRSKAHLLEGLSQEQREKLYVVALKSLKPDLNNKVSRRAQRYLGGPRKK